MSIKIDLRQILGLPDYTKTPYRDPALGEVELPSEFKSKMRLFWLWVKDNRIIVTLVGCCLFLTLLWTKKR